MTKHVDILTSFVMIPMINGAKRPDRVPALLEIPKRTGAYFGAMSAWFTRYPAP